MPLRTILLVSVVAVLALLPRGPAVAQNASDVLEKARSESRQLEDLKKALNDPDQNMRLATFQAMIESDNEAYQALALDVGLASSDSLLRALAFKQAIMRLERLALTLSVDPSQPKEVQERAGEYLARNGDAFVLGMPSRDPERGLFGRAKNFSPAASGKVSGLQMTFRYPQGSGDLSLADDDRVTGRVVVRVGRYPTPMQASGRIR